MLLIVPHLDDETFSFGSYILNRNPDDNLTFKIPCKHIFEYKQIDSDLLITVMCSGGRHNKDNRLNAFRKNCKIFKASYVVFDFDDENMYKYPVPTYVDLMYELFEGTNKLDVCTVSENDLHQEHFLVSRITKIACKKYYDKVNSLLEFKQPMHNFDLSEYPYMVKENPLKAKLCANYNTETQPSMNEYYRKLK